MAHGTRLTIGGSEYVYIRWIEDGVLTGLSGRLMEATLNSIPTIRDFILTQSDFHRMTTLNKSKLKSEDVNAAEKLYKKFLLSNNLVHFALFCYVDKRNTINLHTKGLEQLTLNINDIVDLLVKHPLAQQHANISSLLDQANNATSTPLQSQLDLLNMIPAQFTTSRSDPNCLNLPMHTAWQRLAPKHTIIHHSHNIKLIESSLNTTLSTCHQIKQRSYSKTNVRKVQKKDDLQRFLSRFQKRVSSSHKKFISCDITSQQYKPDVSALEIFQKEMPAIGHIRVTKLEAKSITVVWNKFDPLLSKLYSSHITLFMNGFTDMTISSFLNDCLYARFMLVVFSTYSRFISIVSSHILSCYVNMHMCAPMFSSKHKHKYILNI